MEWLWFWLAIALLALGSLMTGIGLNRDDTNTILAGMSYSVCGIGSVMVSRLNPKEGE